VRFCPIDKAAVFTDAGGRMHIELEGDDLSLIIETRAFADGLHSILGRFFCAPEQTTISKARRLRFSEMENYLAMIGVAVRKKSGERISGDSGTYSTPRRQSVYILSDGMGSGKEASLESTTRSSSLNLFKGGHFPQKRQKTINPVLKIRMRGQLRHDRYPVARSFFRRMRDSEIRRRPHIYKNQGKVNRITSSSLPDGLQQDVMRLPTSRESGSGRGISRSWLPTASR
jgi:stage II sporulation protein E